MCSVAFGRQMVGSALPTGGQREREMGLDVLCYKKLASPPPPPPPSPSLSLLERDLYSVQCFLQLKTPLSTVQVLSVVVKQA